MCNQLEIFDYIVFSLFSDYTQIVDTPMDLRTVREDLHGGNYETPLDFAKDMRLIFTNSRNYNTNKRSKVCNIFYYRVIFLYNSFQYSKKKGSP